MNNEIEIIGTTISLKGDKGDKGDRGEQGIQGIQGIQGERGLQGAKGDKGDKGDKGEKGDTGDLDQSKIVDNLTSTDNTKVLSAKQGKVLKDLVDKKPYYFNTVADMKAYNLSAGDMAITKGYYSVNDGGGAEYNIVSTTSNYSETLNNNLKAELIIKKNIYPEQLGAYGDGTHDDTISIQNAINISSVNLQPNKTYLVTSTITISNCFSFYGNDSIIKYDGNVTENYLFNININVSRQLQRKSNFNIVVDCNKKCNGISLTNTIGNYFILTIYNANYGLKIPTGTNSYENIISAEIDYYNGYGEIGANVLRTDNIFKDLTILNYKIALHNEGSTYIEQFHAWLDRNAKNIYDISTMLEDNSNGQGVCINYFYSDTYRYGVKTTNYAYPHISNYFYLVNKDEIGDEIALENPAYTFKRIDNKGQLFVDYLKSYETYDYLHVIDTTTDYGTNYIVTKATLSNDIYSNMAIKEVVFPMSVYTVNTPVFNSLPTSLQNSYNGGVISVKPYGKNGIDGYIATYTGTAKIYVHYGSNVTNVANWKQVSLSSV